MNLIYILIILLTIVCGIISSASKLNEFSQCIEAVSEYSATNKTIDFCKGSIHNWTRLSSTVQPIEMKIQLQPHIHTNNMKDYYFEGQVKIELEINYPHRFITIHCGPNLHFDTSKIQLIDKENKKSIEIIGVYYFSINQWLILELGYRLIDANKYYLVIPKYWSRFSNIPYGLYLQKYKSGNKIRHSLSTLFSPFYARNSFPCFDDPKFQSKITLKIIRKSNWRSQSVASLNASVSLDNDWVADNFESTPLMQIYEFTFAVNQFSFISKDSKSGISVKLWAPKSYLKYTKMALQTLTDSIDNYAVYFKNSYPFRKLDVVMVTDMPIFETGSSTYGLLFIMENVILFDSNSTPLIQRINKNTITHEISHLWIGNNLKMEWFDSLWAIEGLAGYMEEKSTEYKNELKLSNIRSQTYMGMLLDESRMSHKLNMYPFNMDDVEFLFDDLIFTKGFSLIRMIEGVMGKTNFQKVLQDIMNDKKKKPMATRDLWIHMDYSLLTSPNLNSNMPSIQYIMQYWEEQAGYPILTAVRRYNQHTFEIRQKPISNTDQEFRWPIPLKFATSIGENIDSHRDIKWMYTNKGILEFSDQFKDSDWIIINNDATGYYRVNYDTGNWLNIIKQLRKNHKKIPNVSRLQLLSDCFYFFKKAMLFDSSVMFKMLPYLKSETDPIIWKTVPDILNIFFSISINDPIKIDVEHYFQNLMSNVYKQVAWIESKAKKPREIYEKMMDQIVVHLSCKFGLPDCLKKLRNQFRKWLKTGHYEVDNRFLQSIICYGVKYSSQLVWQKIFNKVKENKYRSYETYDILKGLACTKHSDLLQKYWDLLNKYSKLPNLRGKKLWFHYIIYFLADNPYSKKIFTDKLCKSNFNISESSINYVAAISAYRKMTISKDCRALKELYKIRMAFEAGKNVEIEITIQQLEDRDRIQDLYFKDFVKWIKKHK